MPAIIKPSRVATAIHTEPAEGGGQMTFSAFVLFDFADPRKFLTEQALWPMVVEQMPKGAIFDKGQLKPKGEMIVVGAALAPGDQPITGIKVTARLGAIEKRLAVFGDRYWRMTDRGVVMTDARPFDRMSIDDQHAFGGLDHKVNPRGKGDKARQIVDAGYEAPLPNVEDADRLIRSVDDRPLPASFGPLLPDAASRMRYAGTYDQHWLKNVAPKKPADFNPLFHCDAPEDQRLDAYFIGDEVFAIAGMSHGGLAGGRLPNVRLRAFIHRPADGSFTETRMVCDTVTLFPNITKATMAFRGVAKSADAFCDDIGTVMVAVEHAEDAPRPADYYLRIFGLRTDLKEAYKHALSDFQLMPEVDPGVISARRAAKLEAARAKKLLFLENQQWSVQKALVDQGLSPDLAPTIAATEAMSLPLLPMPSEEEIAEHDFDLAELLDDVNTLKEALTEMSDRQMASVELQRREIVQSMPASLLPPIAHKPIVDDAHLARFADLAPDDALTSAMAKVEKMFAEITPAMRNAESQLVAGPFGPASNNASGKVSSALDKLFGAIAETGPDPEEVEKQFRAACARAMREPEGSPLFEARKSIDDLAFDMPNLSAPADGSASDMQQQFADLFQSPMRPKAPAAPFSIPSFPESEDALFDRNAAYQGLGEASSAIEKHFPHLVAEGEGNAIERLMAKVAQIAPPPDESLANLSPAEIIGRKKEEAVHRLDDAEAAMEEAMRNGRQSSPAAIFPMEPLLPGVGDRLGRFVTGRLAERHDFKGADLAGAGLQGVDFSGLDLAGTFFERADLTNARFVGANLEGAVFTEAILDGTDFTGARMGKANLNKASLRGTTLDNCTLDNCTIIGSNFTAASLRQIKASKITFIEATLDGADFTSADLDSLQILKCTAEGLIMDKARISRASLMRLSAADCSFEEAELTRLAFAELSAPGASFIGATFRTVCFIGKTDLNGGRFDRLDAMNASWNTADLSESCFLRARCDACLFNNCDMSASDLRLASMKKSRFDKSILADSDLFGANLFGASMGHTDLRRASLRAANLYFSNLTEAKLGSADLSGANLGKTLLEMATDA